MKKLVLITGVILIACVVASSLAVPPASAAAGAVSQEAPRAEGYVIRDSGGKIAVFRSGEAAPVLVTDTLTESLPRADAKRIRSGIEAKDEHEMKKILEDYCS